MLVELCLHFGLSTDEHDFTDFFLRIGMRKSVSRLQVNQVNQ